MPQHDVSPDMIFKYPMSPDPPILPCSNNDSCAPSLQPIIVVPPPAPAPAPASMNANMRLCFSGNFKNSS